MTITLPTWRKIPSEELPQCSGFETRIIAGLSSGVEMRRTATISAPADEPEPSDRSIASLNVTWLVAAQRVPPSAGKSDARH